MNNESNEKLVKDLTAKDEQKALEAARTIVDGANAEAFKLLVEKSEYLFDFVKANVNKRLQKVIDESNFKNLTHFLNSYSPDFEDTIMGAFAKFADEDLTDEMLEMLENGTDEQKAYSAKYFSYIPDTISAELLTEYSMSDNEAIAFNAARALGSMKIDSAYDNAVKLLDSDDEFTVLKSVKFLIAYEDKKAVDPIIKAMEHSSMCENIAGEIPYLESLLEILNRNKEGAMLCIDNILSGLGEILPLSQIFCYEMFNVLEALVNLNKNNKDSQAAVLLLLALSKFETFVNNDEYTFDEDKNTKQEINDIYNLLQKQPDYFWNAQKAFVLKELKESSSRALSALEVVKEYKLTTAKEQLHELLHSDNEILICEAVGALKQLNMLDGINKDEVLSRVQDENKKAIIANLF